MLIAGAPAGGIGVRGAVCCCGGVREAGPDPEPGRPGGGQDAGVVPLRAGSRLTRCQGQVGTQGLTLWIYYPVNGLNTLPMSDSSVTAPSPIC